MGSSPDHNRPSHLTRLGLVLLIVLSSSAAQAELELSIDLNRTVTTPSGQVLVSGVVSNNGSTLESNLELRMIYPSGLISLAESLVEGPIDADASCQTDTGSSASCSANEPLVWTFGAIAPGQAVPVSFPLFVPSTAAANDNFDLDFTLSDQTGARATASTQLTVGSNDALDMRVSVNQNPVAVDGQIRYTLSYGNRSTSSVTNSSLAFNLPANATFVSATGGGTAAGSVVSWTLGSLPAGATEEQEVIATINSVAAGTLLATSTNISGISASLPVQQTTQTTSYAGIGSPLAITLQLQRQSDAPASNNLLSMTVANATTSTVFGGTVKLRLPAGINSVAESVVNGPVDADASCGTDIGSSAACSTGEFLVFPLGNITAGRAIRLSLPFASFGSATLNPPGSVTDWVVNLADDSGALETEALSLLTDANQALNLSVTTDRLPVAADKVLTYELDYGNTSAQNITNTTLSLTLPAGVTSNTISDDGNLSNGVVSWNLASVPAGTTGRRTVTVDVQASTADGSLLETEASISGLLASLASTQRTAQTTPVNQGSALELTLAVSPSPLTPGSPLLAELIATNPSDSVVFGGNVLLRLPEGTGGVVESLVEGPLDADASCGTTSGTSAGCNTAENLIWQLGNVAPGQAVRLGFPTQIISAFPAGAVMHWEAFIADDAGELESTSQAVPVVAESGLRLSVTEDRDPVPAGASMTYTLNYGNALDSSVTNSMLSFELPENVSFNSATGGGQLSGNTVVWDLGSLLSETIDSQNVVVTVAAAATQGTALPARAMLTGTNASLPVTTHSREGAFVGNGSTLGMELNVTPNPSLGGDELSVEITVNNPTTELVEGAVVQMRTPTNINGISESLVQGPIDLDLSCANDSGSSAGCTANEFLVWDLGNVAPGQIIDLALPATITSSLSRGNQVSWEAVLADDSTALTTESAVVQIGEILPAGPIGASLLPVSRSVQVGVTATAFASVVNSSTNDAFDCSIAPITNVPATFSYQATDPATNAIIGTADTPIDIPAGGSRSFVFAFTPTAEFSPTDVALNFDCANSDPAAVFPGLNTFLLSAETAPIPDVIGLTTTTDLQVITGETGLFAVGSANVGATGDITVSLDDGNANVPAGLRVCQTNPTTGACSSAVGPTVTFSYGAGTTASFAIFVDASSGIEFNPAVNRIFIRFTDDEGVVRGATSTAVRTQ